MDELFISRVRVKLLRLFLSTDEALLHVREIVRRTSEEINAVRRELSHLEKKGIMSKEHRANRLFYSLRKDYSIYYDLLELIVKTTGMGGEIIKNKPKLGKVKFAMIAGKFARNLKKNANEVDLLLVGKVVLPEINQIVRAEEVRREKEINYTVMPEEEFTFRKRRDARLTTTREMLKQISPIVILLTLCVW